VSGTNLELSAATVAVVMARPVLLDGPHNQVRERRAPYVFSKNGESSGWDAGVDLQNRGPLVGVGRRPHSEEEAMRGCRDKDRFGAEALWPA
jgi:hypothetical protein